MIIKPANFMHQDEEGQIITEEVLVATRQKIGSRPRSSTRTNKNDLFRIQRLSWSNQTNPSTSKVGASEPSLSQADIFFEVAVYVFPREGTGITISAAQIEMVVASVNSPGPYRIHAMQSNMNYPYWTGNPGTLPNWNHYSNDFSLVRDFGPNNTTVDGYITSPGTYLYTDPGVALMVQDWVNNTGWARYRGFYLRMPPGQGLSSTQYVSLSEVRIRYWFY